MGSTPLWFASGTCTVFGWLHVPEAEKARGAVVLCPPVATEMISAHDTFRELAERLEAHGHIVLRFDYPGTGDSMDPPTMDLVPLWLESIDAAVQVVRSTGVSWVAAVGMRLGATLLAGSDSSDADEGCEDGRSRLDAMVLWDPCADGSFFLRQQRTAYRFFFPGSPTRADDDTTVDIPGSEYPAPLVDGLKRLRLAAPVRRAGQTLVLTRPTVKDATFEPALGGLGTTWMKVEGQPELLDIGSPESVIPSEAISTISAWLTEVAPAEPTDVATAHVSSSSAILPDGAGTERFLRLGGLGLFGIATTPAEARPGAPIVVFINTAAEVHVGPARQWVSLARRLGAEGFTSVRLDLSGLGDSPARSSQARRVIRSPYVVEDIVDAATTLRPEDTSDLVLVGLCSGANAAIDAGCALHARGVIALNPVSAVDIARISATPTPNPRATPQVPAGRPWAAQTRTYLRTTLPTSAWRLAHLTRIWSSPAADFETVAASAERTLLLFSKVESHPFVHRGRWIVDRLSRTHQFELAVIEAMDHSLLMTAGRREATELVVERLLAWWPQPAPPPGADPPKVRRRWPGRAPQRRASPSRSGS